MVNAGDTQGTAGDKCERMTTVKAFADLQGPVAVAYAAVTSSLYNNMVAAANA